VDGVWRTFGYRSHSRYSGELLVILRSGDPATIDADRFLTGAALIWRARRRFDGRGADQWGAVLVGPASLGGLVDTRRRL